MAADPLQHVTVGEPLLPRLTAEAWNAFCDAAKHDKAQQNNLSIPVLPDVQPPSVIALVRNDAGGDLGAFSIVKLTGIAVSTAPVDHEFQFRAQPLLTAGIPGSATDLIGISYEPIRDGGIGKCVIGGISLADVKINDASHGYAIPINGDVAKLESATAGPARIEWKAASGSIRRCVVVLWDGAGAGGGSSSITTFKSSPFIGYSIATDDTWENITGLTIALTPSKKYFVTVNFRYGFSVSAGQIFTQFRVLDTGNSVSVVQPVDVYFSASVTEAGGVATLTTIYTAGSSTPVLQAQGFRSASGGNVYSQSDILTDSEINAVQMN